MALMVRRAVEPSELLVAELLVEAGRLKAERVEPSGMTAAVARSCLRLSHQLAADTATAQTLGDPEVSNEEPSAISLAGETRNDLSLVPDEDTERDPSRMVRPSLLIEGLQPVGKDLDIRFGGVVFDRELVSGSPTERTTTVHRKSISRHGAMRLTAIASAVFT